MDWYFPEEASSMASPSRFRNPDPLMTVRQLAEWEGMTQDRVWFLIKRCGLPCYKAGGVRIRWSEYTAWLRGRIRKST